MLEATADVSAPLAPALPVVPRRPQRPAQERNLPRVEWRARPVTVTNLFSDLFGNDDIAPPAPLSARDRGRARMQALARAREMAATPELFNLWHDAFDADDLTGAQPVPANDCLDPDGCGALGRVRAALYAEDAPDLAAVTRAMVAARKDQSIQMRIAVQAMNGTLIVVAAPVGAAVLTYSLFRGEDLRLTGNALAVCGALMALVQTGLNFV